MISVAYDKHYKGRTGGATKDEPRWKYTFSADDRPIAYMTPIGQTDQIWIDDEIFICRRYSRFVSYTLRLGLEHQGKQLAFASHATFSSNWWINYDNSGKQRELLLRLGWGWRGNVDCHLFESKQKIGRLARGDYRNAGAIIELPRDISLPRQLFIFRVAQIIWERATKI